MNGNYKQVTPRLAAALDRAKAANLALSALLGRAGVPRWLHGSVYRWARGGDPTLSRFEMVMPRIEAQLAEEEARLREALRLPEAAE